MDLVGSVHEGRSTSNSYPCAGILGEGKGVA